MRSFEYRTQAVYAANGTFEYRVDPLAFGGHTFPNLVRLDLDRGHGEHGYKVLATDHQGGDSKLIAARLLEKAPRLEELSLPVPPDEDFFRGGPHPLRALRIDSAYEERAADFVRRLSGCGRFPSLRVLEFTDYRQDYMDGWRAKATPFEDCLRLFRSPVGRQLETIRLLETSLAEGQVRELLSIRSQGVEITTH